MVNCSYELEKYWDEKVKMSKNKFDKLIEKRDAQLNKIKSKIEKDNKVSLKIVEIIHQGSCRMKTLIKQDEEYDIDVGIVFDENSLKKNNKTHPGAIKDYILDKLKDGRFTKPTEKKKNCIRIFYKDNYHIDIVVYNKKQDTEYYLASSEWEKSNPKNINSWFDEEKRNKLYLRKIVQLLKKWSKSRDGFNMPSGLIFTILASECYFESDRLDESFYKTLQNIKNRLKENLRIYIPNTNIEITSSNKHKNRVKNFLKRLEDDFSKDFGKLSIEQDKNRVLNIWKKFFNDDFFDQFAKTKQVASESYLWRSH